jgi:hypothetical protein
MYRSFDVWKRKDERTLARYRCFEVLPDKGFCVQSLDLYSLPVDEKQLRQLDEQFLTLLTEVAPEDRSQLHPTIAEAIAAHDREFENG